MTRPTSSQLHCWNPLNLFRKALDIHIQPHVVLTTRLGLGHLEIKSFTSPFWIRSLNQNSALRAPPRDISRMEARIATLIQEDLESFHRVAHRHWKVEVILGFIPAHLLRLPSIPCASNVHSLALRRSSRGENLVYSIDLCCRLL